MSYFTLNKIKINGGARRYLQNKKIKTIKFAIHKVVISRLHASQLASRRSGSIQNKMRRRSNKALKTTSWRRSFSPQKIGNCFTQSCYFQSGQLSPAALFSFKIVILI